MLNKIANWISSGLQSGYLPYAPGTWASLYTSAICYLLMLHTGWLGLGVFFALVFVFGFWAVDRCLKQDKDPHADPSWIVIDEVVGQALVFFYLIDVEAIYACLAFALFRFFDILKPWPISFFDKKLKGALGVMTDDLAAGLFAGLLLVAAQIYWV